MEEAERPRHNWTRFLAARGAINRDPYGSAHKRIRRELIAEDPNCRRCGKLGSHADHKLAICMGGETTKENMTLLCLSCSRSKTAQEGNFVRWHGKPGADETKA